MCDQVLWAEFFNPLTVLLRYNFALPFCWAIFFACFVTKEKWWVKARQKIFATSYFLYNKSCFTLMWILSVLVRLLLSSSTMIGIVDPGVKTLWGIETVTSKGCESQKKQLDMSVTRSWSLDAVSSGTLLKSSKRTTLIGTLNFFIICHGISSEASMEYRMLPYLSSRDVGIANGSWTSKLYRWIPGGNWQSPPW